MENTGEDFKLHYFNVNGRAAVIRALLSWKKVNWENKLYSFEDWAKVKKSGDFEFEQIPMLEWKDLKLVQSSAIILTLAKLFGLSGSTDEEEYLHTSIISVMEDIIPKFTPAVFPMTEQAKANQEASKKDFLEVHAPFYLSRFEARYKKHGGKYFVGDKLSVSDFALTVYLHVIFRTPSRKETWEPVLLEHAPSLAKLTESIAQNELSEYFSKYFIKDAPI